MTVLPPEIKFGRVVGRWIKAIADTVDADELPEAVAAAGQGTLTPVKQRELLPDTVQDDGTYLGLLFSSYSVVLNSDGELCMDHARDKVGVVVPVGFYEVSMEIQGVNWPKFNIEVTEANTDLNPVDLIRWTPLETIPTVQIVASLETAQRAEAAALRAEAAADGMIVGGSVVGDNLILTKNDTTTTVAGNVRGPQGDPGAKGDPGADSTVPGPPGPSAYAAALSLGFVGTEAEWVATLKGDPGPAGADLTRREVRSAVDATGAYTYMGVAPLGTLESAESWSIARIALTGTIGSTSHATTSWTNRESGVYV